MKENKLLRKSFLAAVVLGGFLLLATGCSDLQVYWSVFFFARNINEALLTAYAPKPNRQNELTRELREKIQARNDDHQLLISAYAPAGYAFRFVINHLPSADHEKLAARLDLLRDEGIDPAPYEIALRKELETALSRCHQHLADLAQGRTILPDEELASLRQALKAGNAGDLSPAGLLSFAADPAHQNQFPELHKLVRETAAMAAARDTAETQLELQDAANFFRMAREMNVAEDKLLPSWQESRADIRAAMKKMIPVNPHYADLVKELVRYRRLAAGGKQEPFDIRKSAKAGSEGEFVQQIQGHLQLTGYWEGPLDGKFTEELKQAVIEYQQNHQVMNNGSAGRETLTSFNVPFTERIKKIKLALSKFRRSATRGGDYFVWVNVGGQLLEVFEAGGTKIVRRHRIIIGNRAPKNHTPLFSDQIELIIFYPPWLVPERIIREEMEPVFRQDPDYFKNRGYAVRIVGEGEEARVLAVTQPPGRGNALGIVKILFPNPHAVYLHDTPKKFLFSQPLRPFSHGCMRCQDAVELARFLLERDHNEYAAQVDELIKKFRSQEIHLTTPVPIHIEYITAVSDEKGRAVFFADVYGYETKLLAELSTD